MPQAIHPQPQEELPSLQDTTSAPPPLHRQESVNSMLLSRWRTRVITYFYIMPAIPLLVSLVAHYGAQYPIHSIWIFPGLDIVIAIAFLAFMNMMIVSCDGMNVIRFYLEPREDPCPCNCCKKENAWIGFTSRFKFKYLIMLKPFFDYSFAYFEYYYGGEQFQKILGITLRVIIIFCTSGPLKGMQMFHKQCYKLSRMKRTHAKTNFVVCLAPGIQIQQLLLALLFDIDTVPGFYNVDEKFRWCCLFGILLCFEMVIFAALVTYVFHPSDLLLWDDTNVLLANYEPKPLESRSTAAAAALPMQTEMD